MENVHHPLALDFVHRRDQAGVALERLVEEGEDLIVGGVARAVVGEVEQPERGDGLAGLLLVGVGLPGLAFDDQAGPLPRGFQAAERFEGERILVLAKDAAVEHGLVGVERHARARRRVERDALRRFLEERVVLARALLVLRERLDLVLGHLEAVLVAEMLEGVVKLAVAEQVVDGAEERAHLDRRIGSGSGGRRRGLDLGDRSGFDFRRRLDDGGRRGLRRLRLRDRLGLGRGLWLLAREEFEEVQRISLGVDAGPDVSQREREDHGDDESPAQLVFAAIAHSSPTRLYTLRRRGQGSYSILRDGCRVPFRSRRSPTSS